MLQVDSSVEEGKTRRVKGACERLLEEERASYPLRQRIPANAFFIEEIYFALMEDMYIDLDFFQRLDHVTRTRMLINHPELFIFQIPFLASIDICIES